MDEGAGEAFFYGGYMKEIKLTGGLVALVDDDDYEWLNQFKWCSDGKGYAVRATRRINGKKTTIKMHREILGLTTGDGRIGDHVNGNVCDNRRENLRVCNECENQHNQGKRKTNTSGFKGVYFNKTEKRWKARIMTNNKQKSLGGFATPELAYEAYQQAALKFHGDFANFGNGCVILESV